MPSSIVEVLPAPVARRIEGLKGVQAEHVKLEHELKREMLELEKKVRPLFGCSWNQRLLIIVKFSPW